MIIQILACIAVLFIILVGFLHLHELRVLNKLQGDEIKKLNKQLDVCFEKISSLKVENNLKDKRIKRLRVLLDKEKQK